MKKTTVRVGKFAAVGITLTVANFIIYTLLARLFFKNNEWLWLDSIISYLLTTALAYVMHSKITWSERTITKYNILMFFVWSWIMAVVSPFLTWLFGLITPVYQFGFQISSAIGLPFDYEFIESTAIFVIVNVIVMILNYLFYDRIVFKDSASKKSNAKKRSTTKNSAKKN